MARNKINSVGSDFSGHLDENLRDPRAAAAYLMISLEDEDVSYFKEALGNVARAYGFGKISKSTDIPRATLYNILQKASNPGLQTIVDVLEACGMKIAVVPKENFSIADIVGTSPLPRTQVVKKLWEYIKKNNLTEDVLAAGHKEVERMARDTFGLVRQVRSMSRGSLAKGTKKRAT